MHLILFQKFNVFLYIKQVKLWFYKLPPAVLAEFRKFKMAQF